MICPDIRRSSGAALLAMIAGSALAQPDGNAETSLALPDVTTALPLLVPSRRVPPQYPGRMSKSGTSGYVVVEFMITTSGEVVGAVVVDSRPHDEFDKAALDAVAQWRFEPQLVPLQRVQTTVWFTMQGSPQPVTTPEAFSFVDTLCGAAGSHALCRLLASSPPARPVPAASATFGELLWSSFVVPLADDNGFSTAGGSGPSVRRLLGVEAAAGESMTRAAQDAIRIERERWAGLEREILCGNEASFASGDALGSAVNAIHRRRIAERQALSGILLASLDPELAAKVAALVRGGRPADRDYRPLFGGWSGEDVAGVKATLCP